MSTLEILFASLVVIFILASAIMTFFAYLARQYLNRVRDRKLRQIEETSSVRRQKPPPRSNRNDHLSRDKLAEKKKQEELSTGVVQYYSPEQGELNTQDKGQEVQIVGIAEAKGFWSKLVLKQKLGYILARANLQNRNQSGYWVNLIKAQSMSQGKDQARGR